MIEHHCPNCGGLLTNSTSAAGMSINCRHCGGDVEVPSSGLVRDESPAAWTEPPEEPIVDRIGRKIGAHVGDSRPVSLSLGRRILLVFGSLFYMTIVGSGFIYLIYSLLECQASSRWPTVPGKVERVGLLKTTERTPRGNRTQTTSASVVYRYTIDGKEYVSSRLTFGPQENYAGAARALAAQYQPEQVVTVYYDPAQRDYSVLRRELQISAYIYGFGGLMMSSLGLRMLLTSVMPVVATSNSRWWPWSYRVTWPDLCLVPGCLVALFFMVSLLIGL